MERLSTVLTRFATFVNALGGSRLAAVRRLFGGLLSAANLKDPDVFAQALATTAAHPDAHPAIGEALSACAKELRTRAPAGWTPDHVAESLRTYVPRLFGEVDDDNADDDTGDDGADLATSAADAPA